ncbi:MAG: hypothetical protein JWQ27_2313 [Ferruginibacter sp.]|nr:hypothetical protein [Ferruginibacter sp.]
MKTICPVMTTKDICRVMQISSSTAARLRRAIRKHYRLPDYALITIEIFCAFTHISPEETRERLKES